MVGVNVVKVLEAVLVDLHSVYGLIQRVRSKFIFSVVTHKPYINSLTANCLFNPLKNSSPLQ